jgi:sialate O-acetylesterase
MKIATLSIATLLSIHMVGVALADVRLPGMFSDSMVMQQEIPLPVWGWAIPGEQVVVAIADRKAVTNAGDNGKWRVTLEPLKATETPLDLTVRGQNTIVIKNVLVGEVWLCSGQSNMAMGVSYCQNAEDEIAAADFPQVRIYNTRNSSSLVS